MMNHTDSHLHYNLHGPASTAALEAHARAFLQWRDAEVTSALKALQEQERTLRIDLEERLIASETNLRECEYNLQASRASEGKVLAAYDEARHGLARLEQTGADLERVFTALRTVGIFLRKDEDDDEESMAFVSRRQLVVDVQNNDTRWPAVFQRISSSSSLINGQFIDAANAIDSLLQSNQTMKTELDQLKEVLDSKTTKIAELETTIVLLRAVDGLDAASSTGISPSQLLRLEGPSPIGSQSRLAVSSGPSGSSSTPSAEPYRSRSPIPPAIVLYDDAKEHSYPLQSNTILHTHLGIPISGVQGNHSTSSVEDEVAFV